MKPHATLPARIIFALVASAASGCSLHIGRAPIVSAVQLQTRIAESLADRGADVATLAIACPDDLPAPAGSVVTCEIVTPVTGDTYKVTVTSHGITEDGKSIDFVFQVADRPS